jgi:glycosyltransferase involved in cell wall biosynthesis
MTQPSPSLHIAHNTQTETDVSIVCAIYNEGQGVDLLLERFQEIIPQLGISCELILVDDGSKDDTLERLKHRIGICPGLRVVELSHNFGQIGALSAGMTIARGQCIITMDGDLQHDPGDIPTLLAARSQGYDLVATYRERREEGVRRKLVTWFGNRINRFFTDLDIWDFGSVFRVIDAHIINELKDWQGRVHYNTPMLYACAKRVVQLPITQYKRMFGRSKWTLANFIVYNLDFLITSSKLTRLFLGISLLGLLAGLSLYTLKLLHIFEKVEAVSAPAHILLASLQLALLAVVWREVIEAQKLAKGTPPFVIRTIWSDDLVPSDVKPACLGAPADAVESSFSNPSSPAL